MPESKRNLFRNPLIIGVSSAIVAGLFTLTPIAFNYFTSKAPNVVYEINSSQSFASQGKFKKIVILKIENIGEMLAEEIFAEIKLDSGEFEDYAIASNPGVNSIVNLIGNNFQIKVEYLAPSEIITASFVMNTTNEETPVIFVRSKMAVATEIENSKAKKGAWFSFLFPAIAATSALFASIVMMTSLSESKKITSSISSRDGVRDISIYILYQSGLHDSIKYVQNMKNLTFRFIIDKIFLEGKDAAPENLKRSIAALRAFLLIGFIEVGTKEVAIRAIKILGGNLDDDSHPTISEPTTLRDEIDRIIKAELS